MLRKQKISRRAGLRKRLTESRRPLQLRRRHRGVSRLIEQIEHDEYFNNYKYLNESAFLKERRELQARHERIRNKFRSLPKGH